MSNFVISDTHFGHANVIIYESRPWLQEGDLTENREWVNKDIKTNRAKEMDKDMIYRWNSVVSANDTVYHLGDFQLSNQERYRSLLNGNIVLISGNHDNGIEKSAMKSAVLEIHRKKFYITHRPPEVVPDGIEYVLYGHTHSKEKYSMFNSSSELILGINMSAENWDYTPVLFNKIEQYIKTIKIKKNK